MKSLKSAEGVGPGHPDKLADLISDSILDALVEEKGIKKTRLSLEVLLSSKKILIAGEGSHSELLDFSKMARKVLFLYGYDPNRFEIQIDYKSQSEELANISSECNLANDQGIVFGFASNITSEYLPLEHLLTRKLTLKISELIRNGTFWWAREDFKILVTIKLNNTEKKENIKAKLRSLTLSIQHSELVNQQIIECELKTQVIIPILSELHIHWDEETLWYINTSGSFTIGGLDADSGLTNRKQIIDSFGPSVHHGGGGLSGKDLTKIDRLGAYYARWIAKNIVAARLASELELRIVFAIGKDEALSYTISYASDCILNTTSLLSLITKCFPIRIQEIFEYLTSSPLSFAELSEKAHFGLNDSVPWERLNKVKEIQHWACGA